LRAAIVDPELGFSGEYAGGIGQQNVIKYPTPHTRRTLQETGARYNSFVDEGKGFGLRNPARSTSSDGLLYAAWVRTSPASMIVLSGLSVQRQGAGD